MNEKQKAVNNIDKTVMHEITYYKEPINGCIGWFTTKAGTYFIDANGIVRNVHGAGLQSAKHVTECSIR